MRRDHYSLPPTYIFVYTYIFYNFRTKKLSEVPGNMLPKEQVSPDKLTFFKLRDASILNNEHETFKVYFESHQIHPTWVMKSLHHVVELITSSDRTLSDITPTLRILLKNGVKNIFPSNDLEPYHVVCAAVGDLYELLELMIKELKASLINAEDRLGTTPLMCAVQNKNIKCVETLIANKADVNITNTWQGGMYNSVNPLIDSITKLHNNNDSSYKVMMDIFDLLLDSGADVNQPCPRYCRTPIMYAALVRNTNCVRKLIQKGAQLDATDKFEDNTAWSFAAWKGGVEVLRCFLEDGGIDKNSKDKRGWSILRWAIQSMDIQTVSYLLNLGVTITTYTSPPFVEPCGICTKNLSCYFIGGNYQLSDPYMAAIRWNLPKIVKLMDEYGCQLYKSTETLHYAIRMKSLVIVDYLLCKHKYPLNDEYIEKYDRKDLGLNQTFLIMACQARSVGAAKLVLEHGADPNKLSCVKKCFTSVLNVAINKRHVEVIALIIRGGVNVNTKSNYAGFGVALPFEVAIYEDHIYAAEMLLFSGCSCGVYSLNNSHKLKAGITRELQELLKEWNVHKNNVIPLKQRCRMAILNHLSPQADKKILELPLPPTLVKYLKIPELNDIIEAFKKDQYFYKYVNC